MSIYIATPWLIGFVTVIVVMAVAYIGWEVRRMASALENLTAATTRLQNSVDAAVTVINTPHPTDAQVQTAADAVNAQADRLDAAVNPPAPTP